MPTGSRQWHGTVFAVTCAAAAIAAAVAWTVDGSAEPRTGASRSSTTPFRTSAARHRGLVTTDIRPHEIRAWAVAVQQDGRIVAAGGGDADVAIVRYQRDGRLDPGFGVGGKALVPVRSAGMHVGLAVVASGKILAGGATLVRLTPDGRLDPTFGARGKAVNGFARTLAVQRDGMTVVAGEAADRFGVARYSANGRLDRRFGLRGNATADFGSDKVDSATDYPTAVLVQPDQRIVVIGTATECGMCDLAHFALARFTTAGGLDRAFGSGGVVETEFGDTYARAMDGAIQSDGRIVAAGFWDDAAGAALARYRPDGRPDPTFGTEGRVRGVEAVLETVAIQRDGKILVAGWHRGAGRDPDNTDAVVARYTARGALDRSFGNRGTTVFSLAASGRDQLYDLVVQRDGRIVVAGESGTGMLVVARLTPSGRLDPSFGG
jgi:uncharacterized delta-60 repeat protein